MSYFHTWTHVFTLTPHINVCCENCNMQQIFYDRVLLPPFFSSAVYLEEMDTKTQGYADH